MPNKEPERNRSTDPELADASIEFLKIYNERQELITLYQAKSAELNAMEKRLDFLNKAENKMIRHMNDCAGIKKEEPIQ